MLLDRTQQVQDPKELVVLTPAPVGTAPYERGSTRVQSHRTAMGLSDCMRVAVFPTTNFRSVEVTLAGRRFLLDLSGGPLRLRGRRRVPPVRTKVLRRGTGRDGFLQKIEIDPTSTQSS